MNAYVQDPIFIDAGTCNVCGLCSIICPRHVPDVIEHNGKKQTTISRERAELCIGCGHCAAVCPTDSITVDNLDNDSLTGISNLDIETDQLLTLLRQRRSVRRYKQQPVPREIIDRLVDAAHAAPTGSSRSVTSLVVLNNKARIEEMMADIHHEYDSLAKSLNSPISKYYVKRKAGEAKFAMIENFVMPGMHWYLKWYRDGMGDEISRDCPGMLLFHGAPSEPSMNDNCTIAAFHSILMAETLGIGTCFNHLIPPMINRSQDLRKLLSIPPHSAVFTAVTFGYPKYKWQRSVRHKLKNVRFID